MAVCSGGLVIIALSKSDNVPVHFVTLAGSVLSAEDQDLIRKQYSELLTRDTK